MKSLDEIFGKKKSLDDIFGSVPEITPEIRAQVDANNQAYAQRQEENRPWLDKNPIGRTGVALAQGISNSFFNPAGHIARAFGVDTKPFKPENAVERGIELAGEYGYDAGGLGKIGSLAKGAGYLGKGKGVASKVAQTVLAPESTAQALATFIAPAAGGGLAQGITNPQTEVGKLAANVVGSMIPAGIGGAVARTTTPVRGGLKNILSNNKANAKTSKGIRASEEVAQKVASDAPEAYNTLNDEMANVLDKSLGRKVDYQKAIDNQQERIDSFLGRNSDYPVFTDKKPVDPTDNMFEALVNQRAYNRIARDEKANKGDSLLTFIVRRGGLKDVGGDLKAMDAGKSRIGIINNKSGQSIDDMAQAAWEYGYFPEKNERPDVNDLIEAIRDETFGRKRFPEEHWTQRYNESMKDRVDFLAQEMDMLGVDYSNMNAKEAERAYNNAVAEWRANNGGEIRPYWEEEVAPQRSLEAPYLGDITIGLNKFQKDALDKALSEGLSHSNYERGTLGATHKAQEVLNDMIAASYDNKNPFAPRATTETRDLMKLKNKLNQILEPSGIKPFDESYSKAQALRDAFERGYKFKPSELKLEKSGLKTRRDKRAFLQGYVAQIQDNVLSDGGTNFAEAVRKSENVFKELLPKEKFEALKNNADNIATQFKRLESLEGQANRRLIKEAETGSSIQRENFESKGSMIGRTLDILDGAINRRGNRRMALQYLNPETTAITERGGLKGLFKGAGSGGARQLMIDLLNNGAE